MILRTSLTLDCVFIFRFLSGLSKGKPRAGFAGINAVIDNDMFTGAPMDMINAGSAAHIKVIFGANREENAHEPPPSAAA